MTFKLLQRLMIIIIGIAMIPIISSEAIAGEIVTDRNSTTPEKHIDANIAVNQEAPFGYQSEMQQQAINAQPDSSVHIVDTETRLEIESPTYSVDEEMRSRLDDFLRGAANEGLVVLKVNEADQISATSKINAAIIEPRNAASHTLDEKHCNNIAAFTFSNVPNEFSYQDLTKLRTDAGKDNIMQYLENFDSMIQAYIVLGLYDEARKLLIYKSDGDQDVLIYKTIIEYLEYGKFNSSPSLTSVNACNEEGKMWRALELLQENPATSVDLFDQEMAIFRQLPVHLRSQIAVNIVPDLLIHSSPQLARKVFYSFTNEEVEESQGLLFLQAAIQLQQNDKQAATTLQNFVNDKQWRERALAVLMHFGHAEQILGNERLLSRLQDGVRRDAEAIDTGALNVLIKHSLALSDYSTLFELSQLPVASGEVTQKNIKNELHRGLQHDLAGSDQMRALASLNVMVGNSVTIREQQSNAVLNDLAITKAVELGLVNVAMALPKGQKPSHEALEAMAQVYSFTDHVEELYALAENNPNHRRVNEIAAIMALNKGDIKKFEQFSKSTLPLLQTNVTYHEAAIKLSNYSPPEKFALQLLPETDAQMARRVKTIQAYQSYTSKLNPANAKNDVTIANLNERLLKSKSTLLDWSQGGVRG